MASEILYRLRLWRLQRQQRQLSEESDRKLASLRKSRSDPEKIQAVEYEAHICDLEFEGEINQLQSRHLIRQIERYRLAYPTREDWAEEQPPFYHRHLKRETMVRLRSAVRLERKERWEAWVRWVPVLTALTGLFGTVIGIIATINK